MADLDNTVQARFAVNHVILFPLPMGESSNLPYIKVPPPLPHLSSLQRKEIHEHESKAYHF